MAGLLRLRKRGRGSGARGGRLARLGPEMAGEHQGRHPQPVRADVEAEAQRRVPYGSRSSGRGDSRSEPDRLARISR